MYSGDTNFLGAASNTLTIVGIAPWSVSLQVQNTTLTYPGASNTVVTVTAKPGKPATGAVTIYDDATALTTQTLQGNSAAYWYISPGLNAGTHILTAVYSGDSNYPSGTSAAVTVTVLPAPVNLAVSCWNSSFPYGGNYSCTVNVSSNAGAALGSIVYSFDNGGAVSVPLSYGNAQFTLTQPVTGSHTVAISYAQQGNFAASNTNTQSFTVTAAPTQIQLTPSSYYIAAGSTLTLSVSLTSRSAGALGSGTVTFSDNGVVIGTGSVNAQGQASLSVTGIAAGSHSYVAKFGGLTSFAAVTSSSVSVTAH